MTAKEYMANLHESAEFIRGKLGGFQPEVLVTLGSGLGPLADEVEDPIVISYRDIPHFPVSTAPGHDGAFYFGTLNGKKVMLMKGRCHWYEGYDWQTVVYPLRTARLLEVKKVILTNAAGGVNTSFKPGDLMLISDHIKLVPDSSIRGENLDELGTRFPDMSHAYDPDLRHMAKNVAYENGIAVQEGVYMFYAGPQFETPAEIRVAQRIGADAVGMSTVPETIAANHCGMKVLGISLITNMGAGLQNRALSGDEVNETAEASKGKFTKLVLGCLEAM